MSHVELLGEMTPNPSIERTSSGLRPPSAAHVKRWASSKMRLVSI